MYYIFIDMKDDLTSCNSPNGYSGSLDRENDVLTASCEASVGWSEELQNLICW